MLSDIIKKVLSEASSDSGGSGSYVTVLQPGMRPFKKTQLSPFNISVSDYDSPLLQYDSYDGKMDERLDQIKKIERVARKITDKIKKNPYMTFSDDDGGNINPTPGKNLKSVPITEWVEINENTISEDLAVWFGTKKKPKGSSQPKGPWVNICRTKEGGGHPPCGRPEASDKGYPKCRAAGVASKMSNSQKKAACAQKRRAEKTHNKSGTGNSPKMTSYKPRKNQNESLKNLIKRILTEEFTQPSNVIKQLHCISPPSKINPSGGSVMFQNLTYVDYKVPNNQTSPHLYLRKENLSGLRDVPYASAEGNDIVKLRIENIDSPEIKNLPGVELDPINGKGNLLTYYNVGKKYFCSINKMEQDWVDFFNTI